MNLLVKSSCIMLITGTCTQRPAGYEVPQPQEAAESDVFDRAGIYIPTAVSATLLLLVNYVYFFESVCLYMHHNYYTLSTIISA